LTDFCIPINAFRVVIDAVLTHNGNSLAFFSAKSFAPKSKSPQFMLEIFVVTKNNKELASIPHW